MTKKIATKYTLLIVAMITLITIIFVPVYTFVQKTMFINLEKSNINNFFVSLTENCDLSDYDKVEEFLEENNENSYVVIIFNSSKERIFSNEKHHSEESTAYGKTLKEDFIKKYSRDSVPVQEDKDETGRENINLRRIVSQNGEDYYVNIRERLNNTEAIFSYTNNILVIVLVLYITVCGLFLFVLIKSMTKSIRTLNSAVKKFAEGDYSVRFRGKISNDEVGTLAQSFNDMADTIQDNINSISNYNFLLEEDLEHLKKYEEMRTKLVRNTTHELKTPLAIISSQVEMMAFTTDEEKRKYYYDSAMEEISKMSTLITSVLKYSAAEDTALKTPAEEVDLTLQITELCEKIKPTMQSKNLKFSYNIESNLIVTVSPSHVEHIFNNYIMNALKHAEKDGNVRVTLKSNNNGCRLSVYNDGEKIPENQLEKIWTEFYTQNKKSTDNIGLGLFIVKEISILNHASCGAINRDRGVEFWFDFV